STKLNRADPDNDLARHLILFAFANIPQDFRFWLNDVPYFRDKYQSRTAPSHLAEFDRTSEVGEASETPTYSVENIIDDGCFLPREVIEGMLRRLREKKNIILQGPPGTGKTWLAKRLAFALIGSNDRGQTGARTRSAQFHPSLS